MGYFIYGSKVLIQYQAEINMHSWDAQPEFAKYLVLLKKHTSFFTNWCQTKDVVVYFSKDQAITYKIT